VRRLVRRHLRFFVLFTAAGFALRILFFWKLRFIAGDSFIYGEIAKNWIEHGAYALGEPGALMPTDIRLPGYPGFLALIWLITGVEHYSAVMIVQIFVDVGTCFLTTGIARQVASERAALWAFALAALCPFTANYAVTPLAETLSVFFTALTLLCLVEALDSTHGAGQRWVGCGLAVAASILLRPDGGLLLLAVGLYLAVRIIRKPQRPRTIAALVVVSIIALGPLVPWTIRNWRLFHSFQPLTPRYATNPEEYVPLGYIRWTRTWIADYSSVEDVYWHVPGEPVNPAMLPGRAFDNAGQRSETEHLFEEYNRTLSLSPQLDSEFGRLANQRIANSPLRYYLWLPMLRVADMWLRPRTEALPLDSHWWKIHQDPRDASISIFLGAINLALIVAALVGLVRGRVRYAALFVLWVLLRCGLLGTVESPETRYTLECFPVVFVFAAGAFTRTFTTEDTEDTEVGGGIQRKSRRDKYTWNES
jgi:4-amino-4-deoxy-L-arabinose transferase-like glycosyltransferase